jgi:hypothetical protein
MEKIDIKWLQEYAEQEKRYKWGKQIKLLLTAYEDSRLEIEELKSRNQGKTEALEEWINGERVSIYCVHKNKIKAKIEWLTTNILENDYASSHDQDVAEYQVIILQSLLEKE